MRVWQEKPNGPSSAVPRALQRSSSAYQIVASLREHVPLFHDFWTECLTDTECYQAAATENLEEGDKMLSRAYLQYSKLIWRFSGESRLYHQLELLSLQFVDRIYMLCCSFMSIHIYDKATDTFSRYLVATKSELINAYNPLFNQQFQQHALYRGALIGALNGYLEQTNSAL